MSRRSAICSKLGLSSSSTDKKPVCTVCSLRSVLTSLLCVCVCVCVCTHTHVYMYAVALYDLMCVRTYVLCMYVPHMYACMYVLYVCNCTVSMCVYVYVWIVCNWYVCMYVYTVCLSVYVQHACVMEVSVPFDWFLGICFQNKFEKYQELCIHGTEWLGLLTIPELLVLCTCKSFVKRHEKMLIVNTRFTKAITNFCSVNCLGNGDKMKVALITVTNCGVICVCTTGPGCSKQD